MKIAIASGKGGTGKTTVATNIAYCLNQSGVKTTLLDCDVEEPNAYLFYKIEDIEKVTIGMPIPKLIPEKCTSCGICGDVCRYSAIVNIGKLTLIHPGMCHSCTACWELCPTAALEQSEKPLGKVISGSTDGLKIAYGELDIGEMSGNRLIKAVKAKAEEAAINIIDAPPGTSCPVVETLSEVDFVLLVAEPTPFGLANLKSIVELVENIATPLGVVINRSTPHEDGLVESFLQSKGITPMAKIPLDRKIAELCANGELFSEHMPEYQQVFLDLFEKIEARVTK